MPTHPLLTELEWRGFLHQHTEGLSDALVARTVTGYAGFDPTAKSLHVGNLVPVMGLLRLQEHGHRPIVVVGGGTGLIGDPSGRSDERPLATPEVVAENTAAIRAQLERFIEFSGATGARMVNNADWLMELRAVDFMREVGKHFTVNYMLQKESVRSRMDAGISYTEFSYMLLQAYDYLELHRRHDVTLQVGGSDQWGNITAGVELIRRTTGAGTHALTFPLITTSTGTKFGKTAAGAVWLDPSMTSPYKFYQYWINTDDRDAGRFLRYFTTKSRDEIEALDAATASQPEKREAQHVLAMELTRRVHGEEVVRAVQEATRTLFGGEVLGLSAHTFDVLRQEIPTFTVDGIGELTTWTVVEAVCAGPDALFKSKGEAKRAVAQGGVYVNNERVPTEPRRIEREELMRGTYLLLRKGSRSYALIEVTGA
jgi:tyrosyl-tRNA synthetase